MSGDQPTWLNWARNRGGYRRFGTTTTTQTPPPILNTGDIRDDRKHVKNVWLHLGGAPQLDQTVGLFNDLPAGQGFTGCLHSLRINGKIKEIFR